MIQNWNELQNSNQNRKLNKNICFIKVYPINWITPLTRKDTNNLPPWVQIVEYYQNKWFSGMIQNWNEL